MNVKLNDTVLVVTGKYAGKKGKVTATKPKTGKIIVEGVNIQKKTQKARRGNDISKIIEREGPIDASNVMVICPECSAPVRVKYDVTGDRKVRICRKCGAVLDKAYAKKNARDAAKEAKPERRVRKRAKKAESGVIEESETEDANVALDAEETSVEAEAGKEEE